jgi:hypothetical protein
MKKLICWLKGHHLVVRYESMVGRQWIVGSQCKRCGYSVTLPCSSNRFVVTGVKG